MLLGCSLLLFVSVVGLLLPLLFFLAGFSLTGGLLPILRCGLCLTVAGGSLRVTQSVQRTPLWPASWLPAIGKSRGSKSAEVLRAWEDYDERLQFMSRQDASVAR